MKIQIKKYLSDLNPRQKEVAAMVFSFRSNQEVAVKKIVAPDLLITSKTIQPDSISVSPEVNALNEKQVKNVLDGKTYLRIQ